MNHGFKEITPENWDAPDLPQYIMPIEAKDWVALVLKPRLSPSAPERVHALFETARAAFVYSWKFYPFLSLGAEQCSRVLEAGMAAKCDQLGTHIPKHAGFKYKLNALIEANAISAGDATGWDSCRKTRNMASHPTSQNILPPALALSILHDTADRLTQLFTHGVKDPQRWLPG